MATESIPQNFYEILGVPVNANEQQIAQAYRRGMRAYDPAVNPDPDAIEHRKALNGAHDVISDPTQRAQYNTALLMGSAAVEEFVIARVQRAWQKSGRAALDENDAFDAMFVFDGIRQSANTAAAMLADMQRDEPAAQLSNVTTPTYVQLGERLAEKLLTDEAMHPLLSQIDNIDQALRAETPTGNLLQQLTEYIFTEQGVGKFLTEAREQKVSGTLESQYVAAYAALTAALKVPNLVDPAGERRTDLLATLVELEDGLATDLGDLKLPVHSEKIDLSFLHRAGATRIRPVKAPPIYEDDSTLEPSDQFAAISPGDYATRLAPKVAEAYEKYFKGVDSYDELVRTQGPVIKGLAKAVQGTTGLDTEQSTEIATTAITLAAGFTHPDNDRFVHEWRMALTKLAKAEYSVVDLEPDLPALRVIDRHL